MECCFVVGRAVGQESPDDAWPAGVGFGAADDVEVDLTDDVADGGGIDACGAEEIHDEARDGVHFVLDLNAQVAVDFVVVGGLDFRHKNKPGDARVGVQEEMADFQTAQDVAV